MSADHDAVRAHVAALRDAFDGAFARPLDGARPDEVDLVAIRVAGAPFALRAAELAGLAADRRVVPVPGARPELLGVAGLRGNLVPVFDLAALLGLGRAPGAPRWLALSGRGDRAVGLAFGGFDAYERVPAAAIEAAAPGGQGEAGRGHVTELVRVAGVLRSVIGLDGLVAALRARSARGDEEEG